MSLPPGLWDLQLCMLVLSETLMKINKWITASLFIRIIDYLVSQIEHLKKCDRPSTVISYLSNYVGVLKNSFISVHLNVIIIIIDTIVLYVG